ncbi:MAG: NYN domain-containing protein [Patescibacteria group bacterium]|nr:NYN domain-containing protein [Patescibacteria group bacterium]
MIKHKDQRVGIFVDVQNMYHSAKNLYKANVNFAEILKVAVADRRLVRAIAYVVQSKSFEETAFFEALSKQGFEIKMKDLQIFWGGEKKADWDVGLSVDAIKMAPNLDVIVLVSGDGDYIPLIEYLQYHGRIAEVVAFGGTTSSKLKEVADDFVDLGQDQNRFLIHYPQNKIKARNKKINKINKNQPTNQLTN